MRCKICGEEMVNKAVIIGNLYGVRKDDLVLYICENCCDELLRAVEEKVNEMRGELVEES